MKRLAQVGSVMACLALLRGLALAAAPFCQAGWCLENPQTMAVYQPALNSVWGSSGSDVFAVGADGKIRHFNGSSWSVMDGGGNYYLAGVYGFSGGNVFAVGTESGRGVILHYDGISWSRMDDGGGRYSLTSVWGSSSSDVFAGGYDYDYKVETIMHYDGRSWSRMDSGSHGEILGFWGTSGSDVFAVGSGGTILRYDGTSWSPMSSGSTATLKGVWGTSNSDVYAVGTEHSVFQGMILHYDGVAWSPVVANSRYDFWGVWGSSGNDVFAVGLDYEKHAGVVLHYDGTSWSPTNIDSGYEPKAVWGVSGSDVFAVGVDGIRHFDGFSWTLMGSLSEDLFINVRGTSGDDVFATGGILGECLHFDGRSWARTGGARAACMTPWGASTDYGTAELLMDFWGTSGNEVYAVGENGTILRYDGAAWSPLASGSTGLYLYGVWSASHKDVYAVGDDYGIHTGMILHYDGSAWSTLVESPMESWNSVWGSSGSDVFVVGPQHILHYNGRTWSPMDYPAGKMLNDVWGSSPTDVYAVGNYGTILHYDGTAWKDVKTFANVNLFSVWGSSGRDVYAVGDGGLILHYSGPGPAWLNAGEGSENDRVVLSWGDVEGETGYQVFRRAASVSTFTLIGETGEGVTGYNDPVGCGGELFVYKVAAVYPGGAQSAFSPIDGGFTRVCQPPTGSIQIESGHGFTTTRTVSLQLPATDAAGSDPVSMRFVNSGGTVSGWEPYQAAKAWTLTSGAGTKTVWVQFRDKAGKLSDADPLKAGAQPYKDEIVYDPFRPAGSILINSGAASTNTRVVTLNLPAADTGGSGLDAMRIVNSGGAASAWEPYQTTRAWTLTSGAGTKTVWVQFKDKAGNLSDADPVKTGAQAYKDTIEYTGP